MGAERETSQRDGRGVGKRGERERALSIDLFTAYLFYVSILQRHGGKLQSKGNSNLVDCFRYDNLSGVA